MPWLKLDDGLAEHPKLTRCEDDYDLCLSTFVQLCLYCAHNMTDGIIPKREEAKHDARAIALLLAPFDDGLGFLERADDGRLIVHDYLDYNPTKAQVIAEREANAERVRRWRDARRNGSGNAVTNGERTPAPYPYPEPSPNPSPKTADQKTSPCRPVPVENLDGIHPGALGKLEEKLGRNADAEELSSLRSLSKKYADGVVCLAISQAFVQINEGSSKVDNLFGLITTIARAEAS